MSTRNIEWADKVLRRNGRDTELNELVKVLNEHGYRKSSEAAKDRLHEILELRLSGQAGTSAMDRLIATMAKYGYVKPEKPTTAESPKSFAARVNTALADRASMYHDDVLQAVVDNGWRLPSIAKKAPGTEFTLDLKGLPVSLQEVFKVFVDNMLCGLQRGQKHLDTGDWLVDWEDGDFDKGTGTYCVVKKMLKGDLPDAANFLMFMSGRALRIDKSDIEAAFDSLAIPEAPPIPQPLRGSKTANAAFYLQTHGRDIPDGCISGMKDELYESKLHWIRAVPGYDGLFNVLALAYDQAARGKGKERHANNLPFEDQKTMRLAKSYGPGFVLGQAAKKLEESQGLPYGPDVKELLGAIVYTAAAVMHLENEARTENDPDELNGTL